MDSSGAISLSSDDHVDGEYPGPPSGPPLNTLFEKLPAELRIMVYENLVKPKCMFFECISGPMFLSRSVRVLQDNYLLDYHFPSLDMGVRVLSRTVRDEFDAHIFSKIKSPMEFCVRIPASSFGISHGSVELDVDLRRKDCEPEYAHHPKHMRSTLYANTLLGMALCLAIEVFLKNDADKGSSGFVFDYDLAKKAITAALRPHKHYKSGDPHEYCFSSAYAEWYFSQILQQAALHLNYYKAFLVQLELPSLDRLYSKCMCEIIQDLRYVADNGFAHVQANVVVEDKHRQVCIDFFKALGGKVNWKFVDIPPKRVSRAGNLA